MPADAKHNPLILEHPSTHPSPKRATFGKEDNTPTQLLNYPVSEITYKCVALEMATLSGAMV